MATTLTPASVAYIDTPADLELVDLSLIPPGQYDLVRVGYTGLWHYRGGETATVDHITVATALNAPGGGRWVRDPTGTPGAETVAMWYVTTASGSDAADGLASGTALATVAEVFRRLGSRPIPTANVVLNGAGPVTLLSLAVVATAPVTLPEMLASHAANQGASRIGVAATGNDLETALSAVKATADAGLGVVKRTVTITQAADLAGLGAGVMTFDKNVGIALPANARVMEATAEGVTDFDDATHGTFALTVGTSACGTQIGTSLNVAAGQTGFPKPFANGAGGFQFCPQGTAQLTVRLTSSVDLNTATAGAVTVNVFYIVLA